MAKESVLTLTDEKGRKVIVPVAKLAYVEIAETVGPAVRLHHSLIRSPGNPRSAGGSCVRRHLRVPPGLLRSEVGNLKVG